MEVLIVSHRIPVEAERTDITRALIADIEHPAIPHNRAWPVERAGSAAAHPQNHLFGSSGKADHCILLRHGGPEKIAVPEAALLAYPELGCFGDTIQVPENGFTQNIFCALTYSMTI